MNNDQELLIPVKSQYALWQIIGIWLAGGAPMWKSHAGAAAFAVCSAIVLISAANIPWNIFGPFILISLGAVVLAQSVLTKQS